MTAVKTEATAGEDQRQKRSAPEVRIIKASAKRIDDVKPLWFVLHNHHISVADKRRGPTRSDEESWAIKSGWYKEWLAEEGSFFLLAELDGEIVGYAVVRTIEPDPTPTWICPPKKAEMEALALLPEVRRLGVGEMLIDAIKVESHKLGLEVIGGAVIGGNMNAVQFYEHLGAYVTYVKLDFGFNDQFPLPPDPGIIDETDRG